MRILVTGASGKLGAYLLRELRRRDAEVIAWSGKQTRPLFGFQMRPVDLVDRDATVAAFRDARPTVVLHAAALSSVAECLREPQRAERVNIEASALLAELAAREQARLIHVSTDLVFDGGRGWYREDDLPSPVSVYARTKVAAEEAVRSCPRHAVARVCLLFGPTLTERTSFFDDMVAALRDGKKIRLFADEYRTPLSLQTAAEDLLALTELDYEGTLHLAGPERMSRLEMGERVARRLGLSCAALESVRRDQVPAAEPRPRDTSLDTTRWQALFPGRYRPCLEDALDTLFGPPGDSSQRLPRQ